MAFKALRKFFGFPVARVANDSGERIESLRFSVPALRVGVLKYAPGQLATSQPELQGKTVLLYYPPEAVSDPEFLKSLENSPIVLGGHNQSTNELNKKIDGWPRTVRYDEAQNAAMVEGVVKGAREAAYVRANFKTPDFGASALIDVYGLRIEEGTTPEGQKFNAVAEKLKATHLTLAPSVRDPENKIEIINAVVVNSCGVLQNAERHVLTIDGKKFTVTKTEYNGKPVYRMEDETGKLSVAPVDGRTPEEAIKYYRLRNTTTIQNTEKNKMERNEILALIQNTVKEVVTAKNAEDEMTSLKNELGELKNLVNGLVKNMAKNADAEKAEEKKAEGENADHKEPDGDEAKNADEGATLENAKPAQKIIAGYAAVYNVDFGRKTPNFATLANLAGIPVEGRPAAEIITAVNTKFTEIQNAVKSETVTAKVTGGVF